MRIGLLAFRKSNNLTQKEMSEMLGLTIPQYSRIETGKTNPSFKTLEKFKELFPNVKNVFETFEKMENK
jgi:transcriptional regulator with XRE-family HTH domain